MPALFFQNRRHQIYFELLDSFRHQGCPLCVFLEAKDQKAIAELVASTCGGEKGAVLLLDLCFFHRMRARAILDKDARAVSPIRKIVGDKIREIASYSKDSGSLWRRRAQEPASKDCFVCRDLRSQERVCCHALVHFLSETDFWKAFQQAPLLCLDHLEKCMALAGGENSLSRLLEDQIGKLNALLNDLIRHETTGTRQESQSKALEWLADSKGAPLPIPEAGDHPDRELFANGDGNPLVDVKDPEPEALRFENEKLKRKICDLTDLLGSAETRAASLHYRVAELSETNKRLEMGYTGANALAAGLVETVQRLKDEIASLKEADSANHRKRAT